MQIEDTLHPHFDYTVYNKHELAKQLKALGFALVTDIDDEQCDATHMRALSALSRADTPKLYEAYNAANVMLKMKTPFNSEPLIDMCSDNCTVLLSGRNMTITNAGKQQTVPLLGGAFDWENDLNLRNLTLAREVMHDVTVSKGAPVSLTTKVPGIFARATNTAQGLASTGVIRAMKSAGLLKTGDASGYAIGDSVYHAAQRSHPGVVMALYTNIITNDPAVVAKNVEYKVIPKHTAKMLDPSTGQKTSYAFAVPPQVRTKGYGLMYDGNFEAIQLNSMLQTFGTVLGGNKYKKTTLPTFLTRAPFKKSQFDELVILQDARSLNLLEDDLLVIDSGNGNLAAFLSHNLERSVAYEGPSMTQENRRIAWNEKLPMSYKTLARLTDTPLDNGKKMRLVFFHFNPQTITIRNKAIDTLKKAKEIMEERMADYDDGVLHVFNMQVASLGDRCLTNDRYFNLTINGNDKKYYVAPAYNMGTMNCLLSADVKIFKRPCSLEAVSKIVCVFMANFVYYRYHNVLWHDILVATKAFAKNKSIFDDIDVSPWERLEYSPVPSNKVIQGYELSFMTCDSEELLNYADQKRVAEIQKKVAAGEEVVAVERDDEIGEGEGGLAEVNENEEYVDDNALYQ